MRTLLESLAAEGKRQLPTKLPLLLVKYDKQLRDAFKFISFLSVPSPQIFQRAVLLTCLYARERGNTCTWCETLTGSGVLLLFQALLAQCRPRIPRYACHEDAEPVFSGVLPAELGDAGKGEVCVLQTLTTSLSSSGAHTSICPGCCTFCLPMTCSNYG